MIIDCESCHTRFRLDEARIPATGAKVRCSRCKHAFFLPKPSSNPNEVVEAVVEQTIGAGAARVPEPARDLAQPARAERASASVRSEPEEDDWQFSEEIRVADDEGSIPEQAGTPVSPHPDSFDLTGDFFVNTTDLLIFLGAFGGICN